MRRISALIVAGVVLVSTAAGCGTMANLDGRDALVGWPTRPPEPFGGVANDVSWMTHGSLNPPEHFDKSFAFLLGLSDLPLSFVGDVVTLPWATFAYTREMVAPTDRYEKSSRTRDLAKPPPSGPPED